MNKPLDYMIAEVIDDQTKRHAHEVTLRNTTDKQKTENRDAAYGLKPVVKKNKQAKRYHRGVDLARVRCFKDVEGMDE